MRVLFFFKDIISRNFVQLDLQQLCMHTEMPPLNKKDLQSFIGMMSYLSKYSPAIVEMCELLRRPMSVKVTVDMEQDI